METDITFLTFIQDHSKYFKKYDNLNEVEKLSLTGWLYIFSAYCYDGDITKVLPEFTDKFGKTLKELFERLYQYKEEVNIKNIEAIQCTLPCERERLVKAYLKYKKQIKPVVGNEYFVNCRNLIKILMLIIVYISDEDIIRYEASYSNYKNNKSNTEFNELFNRIDEYIDKIKENDEFEIKIEENVYTTIPNNEEKNYICEFCNKEFTSISNLRFHQKSAKFCLKIQKENNNFKNIINEKIFKCEFCDKTFTQNCMLKTHSLTCKIKKEQTLDEIKEQVIKLKEEKEKEIRELKEEKEKEIRELKEQNLKLTIHLEIEKESNKKLEKKLEEYKNICFKIK